MRRSVRDKFFRVAFLLPLMLSPVAVSWMIGKSMLEFRFGPVSQLARTLGWSSPSFFASRDAREADDHDAGRLDLHPVHDDHAARRPPGPAERGDRGGPRRRRDRVAELPEGHLPADAARRCSRHSSIRLIFKLKLADIVINVTSGGPGGATDTVTSFIYREYRDRSNVGYGTLLAMFYLVIIVIAMTVLMRGLSRWMKPYSMTDGRSSTTASPTSPTALGGGRAAPSSTPSLIFWAIMCIFPIYWTVTTSFKMAPDVMQGHLIPFVDLPAGVAGLAVPGPVARHDRRRPARSATSS